MTVVPAPQFQSNSEGLCRVVPRGDGLTQIRLTNFQAWITANILSHDGVEVKREFEIATELMGQRSQFIIPASNFTDMEWPIERMGCAAIIYPGQREHARTAIQSVSISAEERRIFTHTGWRHLDGRWVFLHADGAIDASGAARYLHVRLSAHMSRYVLRVSNGPEELASAIRASLRLVELGPPSISFPLLAATCRAILGDADFAIHLAGETGAFKSELAALHQQHFGAAMNRLNLPGAWSSTGNALEALAFYAKDALVVIDDFAPQGNGPEIARYHAAADRVFRAAGNQAGRSRLDSNAKLRETKAPRALILSTGEDIPRGQSIRARLLILELSKGAITPADLSACQKDAEQGAYAQAFGGFVQWLAGRYEDAQEAFARKVSEYRTTSLANLTHARTPDVVANLQAAFEMYLEFAGSSEPLNGAERHRLAVRCWDALCQSGTAQAKYQTATEPTSRFLSLLTAALFSGTAHLAERDWEKPTRSPGACGWRRDNSGGWEPIGECIGWVDDEYIYLEPTAAYRVAQKMGRDTDEPLPISEQTLRRRLRDKGLLTSTDRARQTLTVRRTIGGASTDVLHLRRTTLLPEDLEPADEEEFTL
jgi:hypothetical protein